MRLPIFPLCEIFSRNFFNVSKGPSSLFSLFFRRNGFKKNHLTFFGTMNLFKILIFCLISGFLNTYPPIFCFHTIQMFDVTFEVKCYIRIFEVISELYCIFLRRRQRFNNKRSPLSQHATSELLKRFPSTEGTLWVFRTL